MLPSWNDGDAREAIQRFVTGGATPGDGFIEPAERIAVFDNDGTLWTGWTPVSVKDDWKTVFRSAPVPSIRHAVGDRLERRRARRLAHGRR